MRLRIFVLAAFLPSVVFADDYVRGHVRKDGSYVQPHMRTESNGTRYDNYSTKGNTNPYTGKRGSKDPARR